MVKIKLVLALLLSFSLFPDMSGTNVHAEYLDEETIQTEGIYTKDANYSGDVTYSGDATYSEDANYSGDVTPEQEMIKVNEDATSYLSKLMEFEDIQVTNIDSEGYTINCNISSQNGINRVRFTTWNDVDGKNAQISEYGTISGNKVAYRVNLKNHKYKYGTYTTRVYAYDNTGEYISTQLVGVEIENIPPQFENVEIVDKSSTGYTIKCHMKDGDINRVLFSTWNDVNGEAKKVNAYGAINDDIVTFRVNLKDHGNVQGNYSTRIYAYDNNNQMAGKQLEQVTVKNNAPQILSAEIINQDSTGYTVKCVIEDDDLNRVRFTTWNGKMGSDKKVSAYGAINGNTVTYRVNIKDFNNSLGEYSTRIYAYDDAGQITGMQLVPVTITNKSPVIKNVEIIDKNESGYTIKCTIDDNDLNRVLFSTWNTTNGTDKKVNGYGVINGNTVTFRMNIKDHKNILNGEYITRIYAYDDLGQSDALQLEAQVFENNVPKFESIQIIDKDSMGYTIKCVLSSADLNRVLFSTMSTESKVQVKSNGYGVINGNTVTYRININDVGYFKTGLVTRIYVYDNHGNVIGNQLTPQNIINTSPVFQKVEIVNRDSLGYTIKCVIADDDVLDRVLFSTWNDKNGKVYNKYSGYGTISGKTITYRVDLRDLKGNGNNITTRIYAYDSIGQTTGTQLQPENVVNKAPTVSNAKITEIDSTGYTVSCDVNDDDSISKVLFPTWTVKDGNRYMVWGEGTISNGKATYRVNIKNHAYQYGAYLTSIFAYDQLNQLTRVNLSETVINASGWQYKNGVKQFFDANGQLVNNARYQIIDVSYHNGVIDWEKVKASGVDGVILRSSFGYDYTNGFSPSQMDSQFKRNVSELNRLNIPYGIYHFTYATEVGDGTNEAKYVLDCLKAAGAKPTLPIYYDLESSSYVGEKSNEFYTTITKEFANVIQNSGYEVGVYANYNWWTTKLTDSSFNNYVKWVAHYGTDENNAAGTANPYWHPDSQYKMWQYSSHGNISGISTKVDVNAMFY